MSSINAYFLVKWYQLITNIKNEKNKNLKVKPSK